MPEYLLDDNRICKRESINRLRNFVKTNDILLLGVTGIGKTTFVNHLQRSVPVRYVSLGEITRSKAMYENNTYIASLLEKGGVWPIETIQNILNPYILDNPTPYILDGAPKHTEEARWIAEHMMAREHEQTAIVLNAPDNIIRERLKLRDQSNRPETNEQIEDRIKTFNEKNGIILEIVHRALSRVIEIDTSNIQPYQIVEKLSEMV